MKLLISFVIFVGTFMLGSYLATTYAPPSAWFLFGGLTWGVASLLEQAVNIFLD